MVLSQSTSSLAFLESLATHPPPSLIVAIEMDGKEPSWRDKKMARGFQIAQWTIAAQPGHPIFLDVLSSVVQEWEKHGVPNTKGKYARGGPQEGRDGMGMQGATKDDAKARDAADLDVLDWTGPGPWTDAVLRFADDAIYAHVAVHAHLTHLELLSAWYLTDTYFPDTVSSLASSQTPHGPYG